MSARNKFIVILYFSKVSKWKILNRGQQLQGNEIPHQTIVTKFGHIQSEFSKMSPSGSISQLSRGNE